MGKDSNGKELGAGIYQRKDGRYEARIRIKGQKKPYSIYDTNLRKLKQRRLTILLWTYLRTSRSISIVLVIRSEPYQNGLICRMKSLSNSLEMVRICLMKYLQTNTIKG